MSQFCNPMDYSTSGFLVLHPSCWVCANSCSLSRWCHPATASSVILCFSCPQFFPASGSFPVSLSLSIKWPKYWSFSFRYVLSMNTQGWFPLGLTVLTSLLSKGLSRVFSSTIVRKHQFFAAQLSLLSNAHIRTWLLETPYLWLYGQSDGKVMSLLFSMLSRFVITFLLRSKHLSTSWLQLPSTVILEPKKIKSVTASTFPIDLPWNDGTRCHNLSFFIMLRFKPAFSF